MKNFLKLFGIIVLAVAIGFSFAACYNAGDDGGGGGGSGGGGGGGGGSGGGGSSGAGTLTIIGLPSSNHTWNVMVFVAGTDISTGTALLSAIERAHSGNFSGLEAVHGTGSNGNVIRLYSTTTISTWTGSGSREVYLDNQDHNNNDLIHGRRATVYFSNGSATVPFSDFIAIPVSVL